MDEKIIFMFDLNFVEIFRNFPPQLATMLIAMIPIGELRVALPIALTVYHLPLWQAFLFSFIGNIIPVICILYFIEVVSKFLMAKSKAMEKFFTWLFARTKRKFAGEYEKYGLIALAIFVAIPLPMTGAWTGALAAFLFRIPIKKAFIWISLGVLGAGIIVSLVTLGAVDTLNYFDSNI